MTTICYKRTHYGAKTGLFYQWTVKQFFFKSEIDLSIVQFTKGGNLDVSLLEKSLNESGKQRSVFGKTQHSKHNQKTFDNNKTSSIVDMLQIFASSYLEFT